MNTGVIKAKRTSASDEQFTPAYAVKPIIKYLKEKDFKCIWLPFDSKESYFVKELIKAGYDDRNLIYTHIDRGEDFFSLIHDINIKNSVDAIVSNPPYSTKDTILEQLYALGKPFAMLMPIATLQGIKRYNSFKNGIQLLTFDKRIDYIDGTTGKLRKGNYFASGYFCKDVLPSDLIIEELNKNG